MNKLFVVACLPKTYHFVLFPSLPCHVPESTYLLTEIPAIVSRIPRKMDAVATKKAGELKAGAY